MDSLSLQDFLAVQDLTNADPNLQTSHPLGRWQAPRGEMIYLNSEDQISMLGVLELRPELGPRGRHKHQVRKEIFYIITGKVIGRYWFDHHPQDGYTIEHNAGQLLTIYPGLYHEFLALEPTWMVEYSPQSYDASDVIYPKETPFDS